MRQNLDRPRKSSGSADLVTENPELASEQIDDIWHNIMSYHPTRDRLTAWQLQRFTDAIFTTGRSRSTDVREVTYPITVTAGAGGSEKCIDRTYAPPGEYHIFDWDSISLTSGSAFINFDGDGAAVRVSACANPDLLSGARVWGSLSFFYHDAARGAPLFLPLVVVGPADSLIVALSDVASGGTLILEGAEYPVNLVLSRPVVVTTAGQTSRIGG